MKSLKRIVLECALNPRVSRHLLDFLLTRFVPALHDDHVLDVPNKKGPNEDYVAACKALE